MPKMIVRYCFYTVLLLVTGAVNAVDFPGAIPLQSIRPAASDLVYQGRTLLPDEARALVTSRTITDLSQLSPRADSDLWTDTFPASIATNLDQIGLNSLMDEVEFVSQDSVPVGRAGLIVSKPDLVHGRSQIYQIYLDPKGRSILMRRNLLRKIGYNIPGIQQLQQIRIKFRGSFSKKEFVRQADSELFNRVEPFIVSGADSDDDYLVLQDVIAFSGAADNGYNTAFARGDMVSSAIQGRRVLNSLLLPYNLTDVPESVNKYAWIPGRVINDALILPHSDAEEFSTSIEDAKWMARRILRLSRSDLVAIVEGANFPREVGMLVTEKLISRRNYLRTALNLQREFPEYRFNARISSGRILERGKITQQTFAGYSAQFAAADPENPMSATEMRSLLQSKAVSNVILNSINEFNTRVLPRTDVGFEIFNQQLDLAVEQFIEFLRTGQVQKVPFGFFTVPYFDTKIIAAREVVAGQYQGADHMLQLADVVGVSLETGVYALGRGLPTDVSLDGRAALSLTRTYSHLKPYTSIRASLREPFKNMVVPLLQNRQTHPLVEILKLEEQRETLSAEDFDEQINAHLERFDELFGPNESFMVQTALSPNATIQAGYGFSRDVQAYLRFSDRATVLQRLHIFRKPGQDRKIQIYNDPAAYNILQFALGLEVHIQILELGYSWTNGSINSSFFELSLNPDLEANPKFFDSVRAVLSVIDDNRLGKVRSVNTPWQIQHNFSEQAFHFDFLWNRHISTQLQDRITITHPQGAQQSYIRKSLGRRSGRDFQTLGLEITEAVIAEMNDDEDVVDLRAETTGNPGDTFRGSAISRQVTLEAQENINGRRRELDFENLIINVNYRWKGWNISELRAQDVLNQIATTYGQEIFPSTALAQTSEIQFYSININLNFYQRGILYALDLTEGQVRTVYLEHLNRRRITNERLERLISSFMRQSRRAKSALRDGEAERAATAFLKLMNMAEGALKFDGIKMLVGGESNLFLSGTIDGFRVGDENGQSTIASHNIGQVGSRQPNGPLSALQQRIGIASGELFAYWLLNRY